MSALLSLAAIDKFYGDTHALRGINLDVQSGEGVVLLGPSGCGKSTLLRCINGLEAIQGGTITLQGHGVLGRDISWHAARQHIGMVFQSYELFNHLSVMDNILLGPLKAQKRPRAEVEAQADRLLQRIGLYERKNAWPRELSGGQKQRLGLAGILAMHPRAILLDEPTANLDPQGVQQVREAVVRAAAHTGATLIVVEHRVSVWAQHMDRVIVLGSGGGITHDGAPETVLAQARETLIADGVWVPGYVPETPGTPTASGAELLSAENLAITREYPTKKQLRARRKQLKTMPDAAPVRISMPTLRGRVNLSIRQGEHLSILGPNGAGKSTLALTLAGLLYAADGTLCAHPALQNLAHEAHPASWDVPSWNPAQLLGRIGYVFQEPEYQFVRGTVREELQLGPRRLAALRREPVDEGALAAATESLAERLRLSGLLGANPFTLSGGEKRRLSVASALATAPRVLILDEPTFGQDAHTWGELVRIIRGLLAEGTAVLSITHDMEFTAALGGRSITLDAPARDAQEGNRA